MRCWLLVALLPACGTSADSKPVEYGLRNQDWDGDGYARPDDCNDADPEAFPGAVERCNGIDDDCNDLIDDGIAVTYYRDRDGDGFGAIGETFDICWHPDGYVEETGDCDDADAAISPAALEVCDIESVDEDCNGVANEDDPGVTDAQLAYLDADNDGFGIGAPDQILCFATPGLAVIDGDCDDTNSARSPERIEVCDPADVDEDCDGLADDVDPEGPWQAIAWFADVDGDGFGDPAAGPAWFCDGAPAGWADDGLDCDDGDSLAYPNHYEICDDGLDNDCDGTPDDCGPIPAVDLGTSDLLVIGDTGSELGSAASFADLDGDGSPDLLLGAFAESSTDSNAGAVHVVPASARGEFDVADVETAVIEGGTRSEFFGTPLIGLPDDDGDGYDGLAVGSQSSAAAGEIWIFEGPFASATVSQADAEAELVMGETRDACGWAYGYGDWNEDGERDHILGCRTHAGGSVFTILGPVSGTVDESSGRILGSSSTDSFGVSVVGLGDTDGDGADDVAVGAPDYGEGDGAAFVILGPDLVGADSNATTLASSVLYGVDGEIAGSALAAGDVNGDGYADLFVTAPAAEIGGDNTTGRVYGVLGPLEDDSLTADLRFEGDDVGDIFGQSIAVNGDVNGDGWPDVLVGALQEDHGVAASGGAYLFYGPMTGGTVVATDARVRLDGERSNDYAGSSVTLVPDVSGDGRAEVVVGAQYRRTSAGGQQGGAYLVTSEGL